MAYFFRSPHRDITSSIIFHAKEIDVSEILLALNDLNHIILF